MLKIVVVTTSINEKQACKFFLEELQEDSAILLKVLRL